MASDSSIARLMASAQGLGLPLLLDVPAAPSPSPEAGVSSMQAVDAAPAAAPDAVHATLVAVPDDTVVCLGRGGRGCV